jgi:phage terminase large subunit
MMDQKPILNQIYRITYTNNMNTWFTLIREGNRIVIVKKEYDPNNNTKYMKHIWEIRYYPKKSMFKIKVMFESDDPKTRSLIAKAYIKTKEYGIDPWFFNEYLNELIDKEGVIKIASDIIDELSYIFKAYTLLRIEFDNY